MSYWDWEVNDDPDDYDTEPYRYGLFDRMFDLSTRTPRFWGSAGYIETEPAEDMSMEDRVERQAQTILDQREQTREAQRQHEQRELEAQFAQTLADLREIETTSGVMWKPDENGVPVAVLI